MAQEEKKRRLAPTVFPNVQIISGPIDPSIDIVLVSVFIDISVIETLGLDIVASLMK